MDEEKIPAFTPKLTNTERAEIFEGYVALTTQKERFAYEEAMAAEYGVCRATIHRITHDPKRMEKWLKGLNHAYDLASGQILANLGAAIKVQTDLLANDNLPPNMLGLKQNAAVDLMNRAGLKKKDDEANTLVIKFESGGFDVGMPPPAEGEE